MRCLLRARHRAIRIVRRLGSLPAEAALQVMNAVPAQRLLAACYDSARRVYAPLVEASPPVDAAILHALQDEGVAVTSLSALGLPGSTAMFRQAAALSGVLAGRIERTGASTISATAIELMRHPALSEWGRSDQRDCVPWRETVPPAVRLVPRSLT
jgi:hypothetical protein